MNIVIRPATADDLSAIVAMARDLNAHEGIDPTLIDPAGLMEHAFGPRPQVFGLVALMDDVAVGYTLYQDFFDTDYMRPALFVLDLFVHNAARRQGVGRRLMAAVAAEAVTRGATQVAWAVRFRNERARAFYAALQAHNEDARVLELGGEALATLAASLIP